MDARRRSGDFTPTELIEKYPIVKKANWTAVQIGMFLNSGLLIGRYSYTESRFLIQEESFVRLMAFYDSLPFPHYGQDHHRPHLTSGSHDHEDDLLNYFTASELIDEYPIVQSGGWTPVKIGMLLSSGLLRGKYSGGEGRRLIEEKSFIELMKYYDSVLKIVQQKDENDSRPSFIRDDNRSNNYPDENPQPRA